MTLAKMAAEMNAAPFGTAMYMGIHSNAGGGRGATGLFSTSSATPHQSDLATYTAALAVVRVRSLASNPPVPTSPRTPKSATSS